MLPASENSRSSFMRPGAFDIEGLGACVTLTDGGAELPRQSPVLRTHCLFSTICVLERIANSRQQEHVGSMLGTKVPRSTKYIKHMVQMQCYLFDGSVYKCK